MNDEDDLLLLNDTGEGSSPTLLPPISFSDPFPMSTPQQQQPLNLPPQQQQPSNLAPPSSMCWCFDLRSYQPYFNVNTSTIKTRLISSTLLHKLSSTRSPSYFLTDIIKDQPDAYGPFWITMTLVFVVGVSSNINKWIYSSEEDFESDIDSLLNAMWIIYSFSFGIPLISFLALRCLGEIPGLNFITLFTLYGYSLTTYIPACLLCIIPSQTVHWLSLLIASLFSTGLIFRNLVEKIMEAEQTKSRALLGWFAGCQLIMFFVMKLVFYS